MAEKLVEDRSINKKKGPISEPTRRESIESLGTIIDITRWELVESVSTLQSLAINRF